MRRISRSLLLLMLPLLLCLPATSGCIVGDDLVDFLDDLSDEIGDLADDLDDDDDFFDDVEDFFDDLFD